MYAHKFITNQEAKCKFRLTTFGVPTGEGLRNYSNFWSYDNQTKDEIDFYSPWQGTKIGHFLWTFKRN